MDDGSNHSQRSFKSLPPGGFNDKTVVKFASPDPEPKKKKRLSRQGRKRAAAKVEMDGTIRSAMKDSSDSFPSNWKLGSHGKNKTGLVEMKYSQSNSFSQ